MGEGAANEPTGAPHSVHRGTAVQPLPCSVRGPAGLPVLSMATSAMGDSLELSYKRLLGDKKKKKKKENERIRRNCPFPLKIFLFFPLSLNLFHVKSGGKISRILIIIT